MKRNILLSTLLLLFCISIFSQTATVTLGTEEQIIKGFGGINHPTWYSDLNAAERELAFGNGDGQLGLTVLRTYVSENSNDWGLGLATAQRAVALGATVFASPWNPPAAMREVFGQNSDGTDKYRLKYSEYGAYATHLNDYVTFMRNNGVDLYAISTQNEPDYAHGWTWWTPQESVNFLKGYAGQIDCRIMTPESFQYRKDVYDPILNDAAALANVDIFGTHLYGTLVSNFPYPEFVNKGAAKELWMTEVYTDSDYDANLWDDGVLTQNQHALRVAEHIHYAMVEGNFQTYVFWPIRRYYALIHDGNSDSHGNTPASAGTATKRGYCMAQFSKWIRPGYVRVDATKSPTTNVFVSAYKKDNDVVIVVVNKNTGSNTITLSIPGTQVTSWEQYTTSGSKNIAKGSDINAGNSFQVTLDASSVTTFVGLSNSGTPTVEIVSPTENSFAMPSTISIDATATDDDGTINNIFYYVNDELIQEEWVAPYAFDWTAPAAGEYVIKAVATDNDGNTAEDEITITVNVAQASYTGTPHTIPGTIQFEEFDIGGNGFAYYDESPGSETGNTFRSDEDVDIEDCTDVGAGYNLGYTAAGEWLEYSTNVETTGKYNIIIRAACNATDRTISLASNGIAIASNISIPNTAAWQEWVDVPISDVQLSAGEQIIRVSIGDSNYVNLNYMTFTNTNSDEAIQLITGWNLIGCPLDGSTNIDEALSSIWDKVEVIKDMESFFLKDQPDYLNSLNTLDWGMGYLIKVDEDCELTWKWKR